MSGGEFQLNNCRVECQDVTGTPGTIRIDNGQRLFLYDTTVISGSAAAPAVDIGGGDVRATGCRFTGTIDDSGGGSGTNLIMRDCEITVNNQTPIRCGGNMWLSSVVLSGQGAQPHIDGIAGGRVRLQAVTSWDDNGATEDFRIVNSNNQDRIAQSAIIPAPALLSTWTSTDRLSRRRRRSRPRHCRPVRRRGRGTPSKTAGGTPPSTT